jgi:hypothetical protein
VNSQKDVALPYTEQSSDLSNRPHPRARVAISAQLYLRALHKELDDAVPAGHHRMPDGRRLEEKCISSLATRAVVDVLVFYCNCHPAFSFGRRAHR